MATRRHKLKILLTTLVLLWYTFLRFHFQSNSPRPFNTSVEHLSRPVKPPGVVLRTLGGLGNQLFQYSCSYALSEEKHWPLYVTLNENLTNRKFGANHREFALDLLSIPELHIVKRKFLRGFILPLGDRVFMNRNILVRGHSFVAFSEYCQSAIYWEQYRDTISDIL